MLAPLLVQDDFLSMSDAFYLDKRRRLLCDANLNVRYLLSPEATILLDTLARPISFAQLVRSCRRKNLPEHVVLQGLAELHSLGGLNIARSLRTSLYACRLRCLHLRFGLRYAPYTIRRSCTLRHLIYALLRAGTPVWICSVFCNVVLAIALPASAITIFSTSVAVSVAFFVSCLLHELAHAYFLRQSGARITIMQRGARIGLLHTGGTSKTITAALAGPAAGSSFCIIAAITAPSPAWRPLLVLLALFHLGSMSPAYGDGKTIIHFFKRYFREKTTDS